MLVETIVSIITNNSCSWYLTLPFITQGFFLTVSHNLHNSLSEVVGVFISHFGRRN